jgi:hypothetical protein
MPLSIKSAVRPVAFAPMMKRRIPAIAGAKTVVVSSNRFDSARTMAFTVRDDRIASLVIN